MEWLIGGAVIFWLASMRSGATPPSSAPAGAATPVGPGQCGPGFVMGTDGWCYQSTAVPPAAVPAGAAAPIAPGQCPNGTTMGDDGWCR